MNSLTTYAAAPATISSPAAISSSLFSDFVKWIDRGEATTRTYLTNLRQFAAWMKYKGIAQPARADIVAYREWLTAEHDAIQLDAEGQGWTYRTDGHGQPLRIKCRPATAAAYLRSVCQFFSWAAANSLYPDIAKGIRAPKVEHGTHRKEALQPADVLTIEKGIAQGAEAAHAAAEGAEKDAAGKLQRSTEQGRRLMAMYLLTVTAGLRTIEISRANVGDLETINGQMWLYIHGKGHSEADQKKAIAREVADAIREYLRTRKEPATSNAPLFTSTGNRSGGKRIAATTISKMLKQAMQAAGYDSDRITAHSLRHTAGTNVQEITGDLYATQRYMRHANPATTEIYLHTNTEKREANIAQQLYDLYHGKASAAPISATTTSAEPRPAAITATGSDQSADLLQIIAALDTAQLERLQIIAAALATAGKASATGAAAGNS